MSRPRTLIWLVFPIAIAIAMSATSTASADVLCEDEPEVVLEAVSCRALYPEGQEFKAAAKEAKLVGTEFEVKCESSMTLVSGEDLGLKKGLTGKVTALSFSGCKGSCTKASAANLPYKTLMTASSGGNGSLDVSAIEKEPSLTVEGCAVGKCTYGTAKLSLAFSGGKPAVAEASKAALKRTAGLCPAEVTLTAAYTFQQPGGGTAYQAAQPTPATVPCKVQNNLCAVADRYATPQAFEAKVTGAGIEMEWNGSVEDTCPNSVIKGTISTIAAPMLATITEWKLTTCGPCEETKALRLPWTLEIEAIDGSAGNAVVTGSSGGAGHPALEMLNCTGGANCEFEREFLVRLARGGSPATMDLKSLFFFQLGGGCGNMEIVGGKLEFITPKPLWFERA